MKILLTISYYSPYVSGLTIHAKRLAEALIVRNHTVSILTTQHTKALPTQDSENGVSIQRVPFLFQLSKGFLMPTYLFALWKAVKKVDVVVANLPQAESFLVGLVARLQGKRFYCIYHCEIELPKGFINTILQLVLTVIHIGTLLFAKHIFTYTKDYVTHSPVLRLFMKKVIVNYPPITHPLTDTAITKKLSTYIGNKQTYVIGVAARFAAEKGIEYILDAIPYLTKQLGDTFIIAFAGPKHPVGEEVYWQNMQTRLAKYKKQFLFVDTIPSEKMGSFYQLLDVLILPSLNRTEAFGMVQVEAMLCGVPVIAADLPGVRIPVTVTGMGKITRLRDAKDLAENIFTVLTKKKTYVKDKRTIQKTFSLKQTIDTYERYFTNTV